METPKEIFIQQYAYGALLPSYSLGPKHMANGKNIKYIRADLMKLTAEDVKSIIDIAKTVPPTVDKHFYEDVLKKFNEQRKK